MPVAICPRRCLRPRTSSVGAYIANWQARDFAAADCSFTGLDAATAAPVFRCACGAADIAAQPTANAAAARLP
jgi:hypothetical protein